MGNIVAGVNRRIGWNDYLISGLSLPTTGPNPPVISALRAGVYSLGFVDGAIRKETYTGAHILHDHKKGTPIYLHAHWTHNAAVPAGNVVWGFDYSLARGHNVQPFPAPTTIYLQQAALAQYTHHIIEMSDAAAINTTDIEPDTIIKLTVFRDPTLAADTFADTAFLEYIDIHYRSDGWLTHQKVRPFSKLINR